MSWTLEEEFRSGSNKVPFWLRVKSGCQVDIQVKNDERDKHSGPDELIPCIDLYPVIGFDRYKREYTVQQVHGKPGRSCDNKQSSQGDQEQRNNRQPRAHERDRPA